MKLPFTFWPSHWGLAGKSLEEARAAYELTGEQLERRLVEINYEGKDLKKRVLDLDLKHGKLDQYTHERELVKIDFEGDEMNHRLLRLDFVYHKISEQEYEKRIANLCNEPYIGVKSSHFDLATGKFGVEYDWNDQFVQLLVNNGFTGVTDSDIVQSWMEVQTPDAETETYGQPPVTVTRTRKKVDTATGTAEYN